MSGNGGGPDRRDRRDKPRTSAPQEPQHSYRTTHPLVAMPHPTDILTPGEIELRDRAVEEGITHCQQLLTHLTRPAERMYYLGGIHGFEDCRAYADLDAFTRRCEELQWGAGHEERKSINDPELRAFYLLDVKDRTNENKLWFLRGRGAQVRHVYEHLSSARSPEPWASLCPVAYAPLIATLR